MRAGGGPLLLHVRRGARSAVTAAAGAHPRRRVPPPEVHRTDRVPLPGSSFVCLLRTARPQCCATPQADILMIQPPRRCHTHNPYPLVVSQSLIILGGCRHDWWCSTPMACLAVAQGAMGPSFHGNWARLCCWCHAWGRLHPHGEHNFRYLEPAACSSCHLM